MTDQTDHEGAAGAPRAAIGRKQVKAIQRRLDKRLTQRRASQVGTCQSCGAKQDMGPPMATMASGMASERWKCRACGGGITVMFTTYTDLGPSQDDDIAALLELLNEPDTALRAGAEAPSTPKVCPECQHPWHDSYCQVPTSPSEIAAFPHTCGCLAHEDRAEAPAPTDVLAWLVKDLASRRDALWDNTRSPATVEEQIAFARASEIDTIIAFIPLLAAQGKSGAEALAPSPATEKDESRSPEGRARKCDHDGVTTGDRVDSVSAGQGKRALGENLTVETSGTLRSETCLNAGAAITAEGSAAGSIPADSLTSALFQAVMEALARNVAHGQREYLERDLHEIFSRAESLAPPAPGWQPITSAPERRKVLVSWLNWDGLRRTTCAVYYPAGTLAMDDECDDVDDGGNNATAGWFEDCESREPSYWPLNEPLTHWMAVPAPPRADARDRKD